jgi:hypothetical protein
VSLLKKVQPATAMRKMADLAAICVSSATFRRAE